MSRLRAPTTESGSHRSTSGHWRHFHHEADIGIRGTGSDMAEAFEQAARALMAVIGDLRSIHPRQSVEVECSNADRELLFVDWIDAVIYETATRSMLFSRFEVEVNGARLHGRLHGEPIDAARHHPAVEVKGATLTDLMVRRDERGRWHAQCVVDV